MLETQKKLAELKLVPRPVIPDISIIIPTLGRQILENCLLSIAEGSSWPGHIIVVDQGSNTEIVSWLDTLESFGIQS